MSLRTKIILLTIVSFTALIILNYFVARVLILSEFKRLEEKSGENSVMQIINALDRNKIQQEKLTLDYSAWDEAYGFMDGSNPTFLEDNYYPETFNNLDISSVVILTQDDDIANIFSINEETLEIEEGNKLFEKIIRENDDMYDFDSTRSTSSRITESDLGPIIITAAPISQSNYEGPILGKSVFIRLLNDAKVKKIADVTLLPIKIIQLSRQDELIEPESQKAAEVLKDQPIYFDIGENNRFFIYSVIDGQNNSSLLIRTHQSRELAEEGRAVLLFISVSNILIGIVTLAMLTIGFENLFLKRLSGLSKTIVGMDKGQPINTEELGTQDEIANVGVALKKLIDSVTEAQKELQSEKANVEEQNQKLIQINNDLENMNKLMVNRELKMAEMKDKMRNYDSQTHSPSYNDSDTKTEV